MRIIEAAPPLGARARRGATGVLALLAALAVTAAACSSGGNTASTTTIDKAAAPGQISQAYGTLFNFTDKTVASKVAVIQDGTAIQSTLSEALASPLSSSATGSKIDSTTLLGSAACKAQKLPYPCAQVTYDLLGAGGSSLLGAEKGYAVYTNGTWLVAKVTICSLLGLFYNAEGKSGSPPGC